MVEGRKESYEAPALVVLGDIDSLTQGPGGNPVDGQGGSVPS
jgi:hypothetical protein